jgi:hypothetical protein
MAKCSKCEADTQLYENGNPICVSCSTEIDAARTQTARDKMEHWESRSELARAAHS